MHINDPFLHHTTNNIRELELYIKSYFGVVDTGEINKIGSQFELTTIQQQFL